MSPARPTSGTAGAPRRTVKGWVIAMAIGVPVFLGGTALLTVITTTAIWPGEVERFAPILCEAPRTEAFVVSDTYSSGDGSSSTDFTLYCVSPDGEVEDVGWARPWYLAWALHTVLILAVLTAFRIRSELRRWRADRSGGDPTEGSQAPPAPGRGRAAKRRRRSEPATLGELIDRDFPKA